MVYLAVPTPLGQVYICQEGTCITALGFAQPLAGTAAKTPLLMEARVQLDAYFAGRRQAFSLPPCPSGTDFQKKVWKQLQKIPYGVTITYGELACRVGCPKGARAVGSACGKNPIGILIPCHRVVGQNGGLTGFAWGLDRKKYLIQLEKSLTEQL